MLSSIESPRIQGLDIAGRATTHRRSRTSAERRGVLVWAVAGLFVVLLAFSAILLRHLDEARRSGTAEQLAGLEARARIAAMATMTTLESSIGSIPDDIVRAQRLLTRLANSGELLGVQLGLYVVPRGKNESQPGLLVASLPTGEFERPFSPLAGGSGLDVIALLNSMCRAEPPLPQPARWSYASDGHILSVVPVATASGCWGVVTLRENAIAAPVALSLLPTLNVASSMTGLVALLAALLGALLLYQFRHIFTVLWGVADGPRASTSTAARPGHLAQRLLFGPSAAPSHAIIGPQIEPDGMGRDALEELAHGLKTPVATIIQSLEPLRRTLSSADSSAQRSLQIIESASRRLIDLIQAIPGHASAAIDNSNGRMAGVADIVHSAVSSLEPPYGDVRLRVLDMTNGDTVLAGEARLLRAAIGHIVENAIDFSPQGGEVCVRITAGRSLAILAIEDEGPGVEADDLPRIFNRYFSHRPDTPQIADESNRSSQETPNFGLGLWIAKRNIESLRGRIFAENRRSGGLRVTVSLPIAQLSDL